MRYSIGAKAGFAALLALSLGGKLVASHPTVEANAEFADRAVARMLVRAGYSSRLQAMDKLPGIMVVARKDDCVMIAGDYPPHDTFAETYANRARAIGPLRYAFRGKLYEQVPKSAAVLDYYVWRELRRISIDSARAPVIAIAASPGCRIEQLHWDEVARVAG